jgi:hypothetical protein
MPKQHSALHNSYGSLQSHTACRLHLYGDLYSSPGLDMRQKQLLTCAFLSEADMPDQLFGHALAGLR